MICRARKYEGVLCSKSVTSDRGSISEGSNKMHGRSLTLPDKENFEAAGVPHMTTLYVTLQRVYQFITVEFLTCARPHSTQNQSDLHCYPTRLEVQGRPSIMRDNS